MLSIQYTLKKAVQSYFSSAFVSLNILYYYMTALPLIKVMWDNQVATFILKKRIIPNSPKAIIHWDSGRKLMKWRIAEKKLLFVRKLMMKDVTNIARKAILNETFMGLKGLAHECRELTEMMGIPDILSNLVSIGEIKQAIAIFSKQEMTEEIKASMKVRDRWSEDPETYNYLTTAGYG